MKLLTVKRFGLSTTNETTIRDETPAIIKAQEDIPYPVSIVVRLAFFLEILTKTSKMTKCIRLSTPKGVSLGESNVARPRLFLIVE